ncbi:MAG TPA: non-ribosomal peptide synthetase, partial [Lacipirellulaceae bacterium]|nr:non-ribosomal peptide synthetase [Lacipirellulaceae bacterium]
IFREVILGGDCPAMRCIRLEGDRATAADIELFRRHCAPDSMLANGLGASECGLVRQWRITRHTPLPDGPLPIGTAMDDMEIILLDEHQHEVSEGAVGEIAVRSRYVAVGYWGQPQLTAARFLANQADPTLRTYLTGDLGRMLPGGLLQYCGRKDFVPKIRGEFVDLDTIERALGTIPAVRESVVVIREEDGRDPQLVAYVVPQPGTKPTAHALRSELAQRVPQAMVPSAWVLLEKIPLNANLKVDRKAMLKLVPETTTDEAEYVAPRTTLETQLASIWCEVLEIDRIGVHQNVFDIGADSIRIAKVRSRISAALSTEVPIRMIFEQLTIAEQADEVGTLVASTR